MRGKSSGEVKVLTWHRYAKAAWLEVTGCDGERWQRDRLNGMGEEVDEADGWCLRVSERRKRRRQDRKAQPKEGNVFLRVRQWDAGQTGWLSRVAACRGGMGSLDGLCQLGRTLGRIEMEK
jgi:hypothetical protein